MLKKLLYIVFLLVSLNLLHAQSDTSRFIVIKTELENLVKRDSTYASKINLSVGQISISDLLRYIAKEGKVNLSIKEVSNLKISCNFDRIRIDELIFFLCKEYDLDIDITGNVVSIYPYKAPALVPKKPIIIYDKKDSTISFDFTNEPLINIIKELSQKSGINIIVPQQLYTKSISGYVSRLTTDMALNAISHVNNLAITKNREKNAWKISDATNADSPPNTLFTDNLIDVDSLGLITATIENGNIYSIILEFCEKLSINHHFITPVNAQTSLFIKSVTTDVFLNTLFSGTPYSYYVEDGIYMFGSSTKEKNMTATKIVSFKYRSVEKIPDLIPSQIKSAIQVQPFVELNSIILSGEQKQVARVESFLKSLDKAIPLITIDVIIVEVTKNLTNEAGLTAGSASEPVTSSGTLGSGLDWTLSATSINKLINSFNGFGSVKLGQVSPNFYINLKLLESKGDIKLESTPKLSTLNGHEAILTSGETKYYKEINNSYMGTQNPVQLSSYTWKSIEANLSVKITPYVSDDKKITMNIEISESEFTPREEADAPPGTTSRSFKSIIRVKNEEVVLLGGIERSRREKSSKGLPFIARIPVLKWLFGKTTNSKNEHKLNVFIKPTIID